jgi:hypothetical protein
MTSKSNKATSAGEPTETKAPTGLRFLEDEKPHHTAILAEGSVSGMLPIDPGTWERYVQEARRIIDERSRDYNAMGMQMLGLALCHLLAERYNGVHNDITAEPGDEDREDT